MIARDITDRRHATTRRPATGKERDIITLCSPWNKRVRGPDIREIKFSSSVPNGEVSGVRELVRAGVRTCPRARAFNGRRRLCEPRSFPRYRLPRHGRRREPDIIYFGGKRARPPRVSASNNSSGSRRIFRRAPRRRGAVTCRDYRHGAVSTRPPNAADRRRRRRRGDTHDSWTP